jgi:hypothetical protein
LSLIAMTFCAVTPTAAAASCMFEDISRVTTLGSPISQPAMMQP